jgi:hypothetical protein
MELCAFRQDVFRAYAFWQVLRAMARSMQSIRHLASAQGNGKKFPEHMPFGECSGQSDGSFCLHARSIPSIRLLASALGPRAHNCSSSLCAWKRNFRRIILSGEIPICYTTDTVSDLRYQRFGIRYRPYIDIGYFASILKLGKVPDVYQVHTIYPKYVPGTYFLPQVCTGMYQVHTSTYLVINVCFLVHTLDKQYVPSTYFGVIKWYEPVCTGYIPVHEFWYCIFHGLEGYMCAHTDDC